MELELLFLKGHHGEQHSSPLCLSPPPSLSPGAAPPSVIRRWSSVNAGLPGLNEPCYLSLAHMEDNHAQGSSIRTPSLVHSRALSSLRTTVPWTVSEVLRLLVCSRGRHHPSQHSPSQGHHHDPGDSSTRASAPSRHESQSDY